MDHVTWRLGLAIILVALLCALVVLWANPGAIQEHSLAVKLGLVPCAGEVAAFFPVWPGAVYEFAGEGMEFAAFTRRTTFAAPGLAQIEDLSGTNLAQIVEVNPAEVQIVWSSEEFYENRSLLDVWQEERNQFTGTFELVLLKSPVRVGTAWRDDRFKREIVQIDGELEIPLGTFRGVVTVKSEALDGKGFVMYEYYAQNIGLIKRISLSVSGGEAYTVVSTLESLTIAP